MKALAPGATAPLRATAFSVVTGPTKCTLTVYGPTPFDVPQKDLGNN